ncbi:MAG TPA: phosphatidylethanolamine N-methyltransferase [Gallionella sp.]|jgi:ubiquinone/menaquinone biosynthesis C-methylase UbiE|nr:class I SAM-dependent methyltransferase [Gallionella sp.]OGS66796.1 MAG: phosphatidylethanolamine N-methyltransferase [Gallionellales bacterium GWA2_54_124]HCI53846.1 phosphatidylethanolamine N-methyltransferase [Gallionella sp.]
MTPDYRCNPLLRLSYSLIAPVYDLVIERPMRAARKRSLAALPAGVSRHVLVSGVGTGLDLPHLPTQHHYTALDFNAAMLARARPRGEKLDVEFVLGDSMALPFADNHFDHIVLHLITAVVPDPARCLSEAARVLKPGGSIILFDKFLRPGKAAPLRRLLTPLSGRLATRMDVVFEDLLQDAPDLEVLSDEPLLAGGWFRGILLRKTV